MGNLGVFASKFNTNSKSLEEFDIALRYIKERNEVTRTPETSSSIEKLLNVIEPIAESIEGTLPQSTVISDHSIVSIIKSRHEIDWSEYRSNILKLRLKLSSQEFKLSKDDFQLLNDIADALDAECANLFRRMSERL